MRIFRGLVAAGVVACVAPAAYAQDGTWYLGAQMGVNFVEDADTSLLGVSADTEYDPGFAILGQVGVPIGDFRVEGEIGWRRNTIDEFGGASVDGDTSVFNFMANAYYDIPTGWRLTPYIGAGFGGALVTTDASISGVGGFDDSETVFAYQGIAGLAYKINEELSLKADYRYFATDDMTFQSGTGFTVDSEYNAHSVMIGFSYRFGAEKAKPVEQVQPVVAAPPPPPPPPPAPTNYMVFFDWDKSDLTPEAQAVLRKAADAIKAGQTARVTLVGHADRSGSDKYNMGLSQRRGDSARKFLAGLGVRGDAITVTAKGESNPLVPTPDGVREPQNRRVEIVLP